MQVTKVTYSKTVQEKQYEPVTITAEALVSHGEDPKDALVQLRSMVKLQLGIPTKEVPTTAKAKVEAPVKEETPVKEEVKEAVKEETPVKEVTKKKVTKKKVAKKATTKKSIFVEYDRENKEHRKIFRGIADSLHKDWSADKTTPVFKAVVKASHSLVGKEFMAPDGKIVEEFRTAVSRSIEGAVVADEDI